MPWYGRVMRESSIAKHRILGRDSILARSIGAEIRRRRVELGLSQAEVGAPLTRAFVSAVERGHVVPSLPSLIHLASRLEIDAGTLLAAVNGDTTDVYTPPHGNDDAATTKGRRGRPTPGHGHRRATAQRA